MLSQTDAEAANQDNVNLEINNYRSTRNSAFFALKVMFVIIAFAGIFILYGSSFAEVQVSKADKESFTADAMGISLDLVLDTYSDIDETDKQTLFKAFKVTFNKVYSNTDEEKEKYQNFKEFLQLVDERNMMERSNGGTALHGITKFADISQYDFEQTYLGYVEDESVSRGTKHESMTSTYNETNSSYVNWAGIYTTSINDQGYCGSCWAFSSAEQMESDSIRAGYTNTSEKLSYQQLVSCDTSASCAGGCTNQAYVWVKINGGLQTNASYPYTSYGDVTGTCEQTTADYKITLVEYFEVEGEDDMEAFVKSTGPLSVCLDASSWSSYKSGIVTACNTTVDHCVQAVGINSDERYWIVRNSWGTDWGLDGYIYLESGVNMCNIDYDVTYTTTHKVSTDDDVGYTKRTLNPTLEKSD